MKPTQTTLMMFAIITSTTFLNSNVASADRFSNRNAGQVNYDLIVEHSHDLEYIAEELKDCYRDQFRRAPLYGKLVSRSAKIKNLSQRLYRNGVSHHNYEWNDEIRRLDDLVCELRDYTNESINRSRYDQPLSRVAVRTVRKLLTKAELHVSRLQQAVYSAHHPTFNEPVYQRPVYSEPAPKYAPAKTNLHSRVNRGTNNQSGHYRGARGSSFRTKQLTNHRSSPGLSFNVGGLKFHVN